jgi:hypothetical protein
MDDLPNLNGFEIPPLLQELMWRTDWQGKRTSMPWLRRFGVPSAGFIEFIGLDALVSENRVKARECFPPSFFGARSDDIPPGDLVPERGFLIGFTDWVDYAIYVDFRPTNGPGLIYYNQRHDLWATAFERLEDFSAFYKEQHGD